MEKTFSKHITNEGLLREYIKTPTNLRKKVDNPKEKQAGGPTGNFQKRQSK